jgi:hypothetical protein
MRVLFREGSNLGCAAIIVVIMLRTLEGRRGRGR